MDTGRGTRGNGRTETTYDALMRRGWLACQFVHTLRCMEIDLYGGIAARVEDLERMGDVDVTMAKENTWRA